MKTCMAVSPTPANFAPLLFAGDIHSGLAQAAALGFEGVEFNLRDSEELDQQGIVNWLEEFNLQAPSFGTGQSYFVDQLSLADTDREVQRKILERMQGHVRFAEKVGALVVLGSVRGVLDISSEEKKDACYAAALRSTHSLAVYAQDHGVKLAVEPINRYETNFINTIEETLNFIAAVEAPNIGLLIDTFHMNIEEASMTAGILAARDLLWHVHLVDSNRCAPGMGHTDFGPIIDALAQIEYSGFLSAEILPIPDDFKAAQAWMDSTSKWLDH